MCLLTITKIFIGKSKNIGKNNFLKLIHLLTKLMETINVEKKKFYILWEFKMILAISKSKVDIRLTHNKYYKKTIDIINTYGYVWCKRIPKENSKTFLKRILFNKNKRYALNKILWNIMYINFLLFYKIHWSLTIDNGKPHGNWSRKNY